jgi:tetratricopeptide (TPR) repeat protein
VKGAAGLSIGIIGALAAFPRRLAAKELERQRGRLHRGLTRSTSHVVFGRNLLKKADDAAIEARVDAARGGGRKLFSERGFLRMLGLSEPPQGASLNAHSIADQSRLSARDLELLSLFDAFEADAEPYSFRDLILAKKYSGLIAGGAGWGAIARSVHRFGPAASLTTLTLHVEDGAGIYARHKEGLSELNGQWLLPIDASSELEIEDLFAEAEEAEAEERFTEAAALYQRCLSLDPTDSVAAFNRANCLRAIGDAKEAANGYLRAVKLDPGFVEAWFNLAVLMKDKGETDTARRHFLKAIAVDKNYGDPIYNLAALEYEAGRLSEARRWWSRYLELDSQSAWAQKAARGVQYIDLLAQQKKINR